MALQRVRHNWVINTSTLIPPVTYWTPSELGFIFWYCIFLPFHTVHGVFLESILEWLLFLPPVDHFLSELFTMTCPSWLAWHSMAHSFIELHKPLQTWQGYDPYEGWGKYKYIIREFMVLFGKCATYLKKSRIYMPYANLYIVKIGNIYDYVFKY